VVLCKFLTYLVLCDLCIGDQSSLFTGVLFGPLYAPPYGFRFEGVDAPIMVS